MNPPVFRHRETQIDISNIDFGQDGRYKAIVKANDNGTIYEKEFMVILKNI